MDYKPRRSESDAPQGPQTFGKPVQTITNPDGTTRPVGHTVSVLSASYQVTTGLLLFSILPGLPGVEGKLHPVMTCKGYPFARQSIPCCQADASDHTPFAIDSP